MIAYRVPLALLTAGLSAQTQFEFRTPAALLAAQPVHAVAGDFDGDGDLDLFGQAANQAGSPGRRLLRNDGNERFTDVSLTALPAQGSLFFVGKVLAFDLDNDGDLDLFGSSLGTNVLWRNLGNGTFVDTGYADASGYTSLVATDLDGDGDVDIAASGNTLTGGNAVLVNQGGTLQRRNVLPAPSSVVLATADLEGDGDPDLLLGSVNGVVVARNDGNLVFTDVTAAWVGALLPGTIRDLAVGDLDGDGDPDVVVSRSGSPTDDVLLHAGNAFTAGTALPTVADGANKLLLIDLDEDGVADLLRTTANGMTLALGTGQGRFVVTPGRLPTLLTQAPGLLAADFDRDGDPDVLTSEPFASPTLLVNRHRDLRPGQPRLGQTWQPEAWSQPGYATSGHGVVLGVALAPLPRPLAVPPLGELALDPNAPLLLAPGLVPQNGAPATFAFPIPNAPLLAGVNLHVQAIIDQAPPHLSAWFGLAIQ